MDRKALIRAFTPEYMSANKARKSVLLDEFIRLTGYNRSYATRVLRGVEPPRKKKRKKYSRRPVYDSNVRQALQKIWNLMDCICGQRLAPILPDLIDSLKKHGEIELSPAVEKQLREISSATIDRLLAPARRKRGRKTRRHTTPGSFLKSQIPIRVYGEWPEQAPGYFELDLVAHEGGDNSGPYFYTLTVVDVHTEWTALALLRSKGQDDVLAGLKRLKNLVPFPFLGIDCDNGSEFINELLLDYCKTEELKFTRCRPYRKNDNCFVEQKNYSVVRRNVGYLRYDQEQELELLERLYTCLHLYVNFFQPSKKLIFKSREGSKTIKKYDKPRTPLQRLLDTKAITKTKQRALLKKAKSLNPAELRRTLDECQNEVLKIAADKPITHRRFLDKHHLEKLRRYKRRSRPADKTPSTFVEKQDLDRLRTAVAPLHENR